MEDRLINLISDYHSWAFRHTRPTGILTVPRWWMREEIYKRRPCLRHRHTSHWVYDRNKGINRFRGRTKHSVTRLNVNFPFPTLDCAKDIRILELLPGQYGEPIHAKLFVAPLVDAPSFEAVSYHWGSPEAVGTISCDGQEMQVTQSLHEMLQGIRGSESIKYLWIDAICINQGDSAEKRSQIGIMGEVYSRASHVIIWLGPSEPGTEKAFRIMEEACSACCQLTEYIRTLSQLFALGFPAADDERWGYLHNLLIRPYWTRCWVVQEVIKARKAIVRCGQHEIEWERLAELSRIMLRLASPWHFRLWSLEVMRHLTAINDGQWYMFELLAQCRRLESTDAKDKIYALMDLAIDGNCFHELLDYRKDVEQVYIGAAKILLQQIGANTLKFAGGMGTRRLQTLPSWVPDWSTDHTGVDCIVPIPRDKEFLSYSSSVLSPAFSVDGRVLKVTPAYIGRVQHVGARLHVLRRNHFRNTFLYFRQWQHIATTQGSLHIDKAARLERFAQSLVRVHGWRPTACFRSATETYLAAQTWRRNVLERPRTARELEVYQYEENVWASCQKKSFFMTNAGDPGIGPYFLRPRDILVHFKGVGDTILAMRARLDGRFELVGEVFVQGLQGDELRSRGIEKCIELV